MTTESRYHECLKTMYGLRRFGIKLGLSTIRSILDGLGNPQDRFSCIHIAGTNGKGSVASNLATILHLAGYNVGLYTSPHLIRFNERIQINLEPIADDRVVAGYEAVRQVHTGSREPTFFEFSTAMAFYEFGRMPVDFAIVETGMGGRLDATNVISPSVCVITNISMEHRDYLGDTIEQIAGEKAGIIKPKVPVVTGVWQPSVVSVLEEVADERSAPLYRYEKDFRVTRASDNHFSYYGVTHDWPDIRTVLVGKHQVDNAALALAVCEQLIQQGVSISDDHIRQGLIRTKWPGRLEWVSESPGIILDGAHNLEASAKLADYLSELDADITLVIGILDDKPYPEMLKYLVPHCKKVILTQPIINRALPPETLKAEAEKYDVDISIIAEVGAAVSHAVANARANDKKEVVCIAGSLYVVGEAREKLQSMGICKPIGQC